MDYLFQRPFLSVFRITITLLYRLDCTPWAWGRAYMSLLIQVNDSILMPAKPHPVSSRLTYRRHAFASRARFESQQEGSQPGPSQERRACAAHCFCPGQIILCSNLRLGIPLSSPVFVSLWRQHVYHQFSESPQTLGKNSLWSIFSRGVAMYLECVGFLRSFRIQLAHCILCLLLVQLLFSLFPS